MMDLFLGFMRKGGGWVMWSIFAVSVVVWIIGLGRLGFFASLRRSRARFRACRPARPGGAPPDLDSGDEAYDRLARALTPGAGARMAYREFLIATIPRIEAGVASMSAWISVAPLLGLLGTVMGMIQTFEVITRFGVGNPNLTAEGISVALLTTQAGLTAAFPGLLLQNAVNGRKSALVTLLIKDGEELVQPAGGPGAGNGEGKPHV